MPTVRIEVRQEDIDGSDPKNPQKCMGYRAIKRVFPSSLHGVGILYAWFFESSYSEKGINVRFPDRVNELIFDHYCGVTVKPFWFNWEVPQEVYETKVGE